VNRLRAYRAIERINQEELGDIIGLSAQMVSAIESGRRPFTGDLAAIGYATERLTLPEMSEPLHRQRASTKVTAKNRAQELLRLAGELFKELRARTSGAPHLALEPMPAPMTGNEWEEAAIEVRCSLQHEENGPIRNLTAAVERAGVCVVPIAGLEGIDGLSSWVDGAPVIGVSPNVPGDRFRFTISHELGHLLFHKKKAESTESQANRFAGALLIPFREFDAAMPARPQLRDFINLKASWGVAVAALVYRAHELGYIDDKRYRALQIQMSKWHKVEPGSFDPVHGQLMGRLIEVNGGIEKVASDAGLNARHVSELTNWSHLRVA
jgi:Zn-dependent peptidase ImmA (M78 family)/transcriptional regulator with XRE-family HTH domain